MQPNALCQDCISRPALIAATASAVIEGEERPRGTFSGSEEVRMVRAIALSAVTEALIRGESHVSFHGFRIYAARLPCDHENDSVVRVELVVRLDGHIVDREIAEIPPLHFA